MINQLDPVQVPMPVHPSSPSVTDPALSSMLSAFLAHPAFRKGLADAQKSFLEAYEPEELSEDEVISELEESVSYQVTALYRERCRAGAWEPSLFPYHLGYIMGSIHKGLSYPQGPRSAFYALGQHTLEVAEEADVITIGNEALAVQLDQEEAYRLHLVLTDLFHQSDDLTKTER